MSGCVDQIVSSLALRQLNDCSRSVPRHHVSIVITCSKIPVLELSICVVHTSYNLSSLPVIKMAQKSISEMTYFMDRKSSLS